MRSVFAADKNRPYNPGRIPYRGLKGPWHRKALPLLSRSLYLGLRRPLSLHLSINGFRTPSLLLCAEKTIPLPQALY